MLTGSFVSSYYGDPRTTRDLDLVVDAAEPPDDAIRAFVTLCEGSNLYVSERSALGPLTGKRRQFNVISSATGWKADMMWVQDRPFSRMEFSRKTKIELLGTTVPVPTPEDIVLAKLEWGASVHSRQFDDAVSVVRVLGKQLDTEYLRRWATQLGIGSLLAQALLVAGPEF